MTNLRSIKTTVLVPLAVALFLALGGIVLGAHLHARADVESEVRRRIAELGSLLTSHLEEDSDILAAALIGIEQGGRFDEAMAAQDRERLQTLAAPLFFRLRAETEITHLYFIGPDRRTILRMHRPELHGDVIDRFTTLEAERTGRLAKGIELGPLGTLTIRVVKSRMRGGACIGYLELGHEMGHLFSVLGQTIDAEIVVLLRKEFLDREGWEQGRAMLGQEVDWDRLSPFVTSGPRPSRRLDSILDSVTVSCLEDTPDCAGLPSPDADRRYWLRPLLDVAGRRIGCLVIAIDVSDERATGARFVLTAALFCTVVAFLVLVFFSLYLGKVNDQLVQAR